jgi:hypothetical protein
MQAEIWRKRRELRGQRGISTMGALAGVGATATLAAMLMMSAEDQVGAAEGTVCQYDKSIVMTAVESFHASSDTVSYPEAAGPDGLDQVREAGWLRTESQYWRYAGAPGGTPQYVLRSAVNGCD